MLSVSMDCPRVVSKMSQPVISYVSLRTPVKWNSAGPLMQLETQRIPLYSTTSPAP